MSPESPSVVTISTRPYNPSTTINLTDLLMPSRAINGSSAQYPRRSSKANRYRSFDCNGLTFFLSCCNSMRVLIGRFSIALFARVSFVIIKLKIFHSNINSVCIDQFLGLNIISANNTPAEARLIMPTAASTSLNRSTQQDSSLNPLFQRNYCRWPSCDTSCNSWAEFIK